MSVLASAARVGLSALLLWFVGHALIAPELPPITTAAAAVIAGLTLWRPTLGLLLLTGLAPAGALFAPAPIRVTELFAWSFFAAWLLRLWTPLSPGGWPRTLVLPALLYLAIVITSWVMLMIGGAAGISPSAWPLFLFQSIPPDHLVRSSPEPETWILLQSTTGIGVLLAAIGLARSDRRVAPNIARVVLLSIALLGFASLAEVVRQWGRAGYAAGFLLRYVNGERYALHLADLNAAASLYVLAGLIGVALIAYEPLQRRLWLPLTAVLLPAVWLSGSRSAALAAAAIGAVTIPRRMRERRWNFTRPQIAAAAVVIVLATVATVVIAERSPDAPGAGRSLRLRFDFYETTGRMFASSPIFGVGVGRYFDRSNEFMPEELRRIYGNENAHNYFAQQFAEVGIAGGLLFAWLIALPLVYGWRYIRSAPAGDGSVIGLYAGAAAYLVTCVTGHPLLVPEASLPFWAAFGALAAATAPTSIAVSASTTRRLAVAAVALLVVGGLGRAVMAYSGTTTQPGDRGFHGFEDRTEDGIRYRLMTRHAVTYIPATPGFLTLQLRAPEERGPRPLVVEVVIDGRVVQRRELQSNRWTKLDLGVRDTVRTPFRRIDLRANQEWTQEVLLGRRTARRPISAMVGEVVWTPTE